MIVKNHPRPHGLLSYWDGNDMTYLRPKITKGPGDELALRLKRVLSAKIHDKIG